MCAASVSSTDSLIAVTWQQAHGLRFGGAGAVGSLEEGLMVSGRPFGVSITFPGKRWLGFVDVSAATTLALHQCIIVESSLSPCFEASQDVDLPGPRPSVC
jgi:hypothetical protein